MGKGVEFYSGDNINGKYSEFLKGKRVALVGPANRTKGTKQKDNIDSYDVVIRMNLAYKVPPKIQADVGERVDVLYCALSNYYFDKKILTENRMLKFKNNIKWIISTGTHRENILKLASCNKSARAGVGIRQIGRRGVDFVSSKLKKKPSAGVLSIYDLLSHDISELYLTGFTFYNFMLSKDQRRNRYYYSGYSPGYLDHAGNVYTHDVKGEAKFVKKMCKKDGRVKVDNLLKDIFSKLK